MFIKKICFCTMLCGVLFATQAYSKPVLPVQNVVTTNGVPLYFVQTQELPMVDIALVFDAGSRRDAVPGIANFTGAMLDEGTTQWNADQIATQLDKLTANLSVNTNKDFTVISLRSLTQANLLNPAVGMLSQILQQVNFPLPAFQRTQRNILNAIEEIEQSPETLATQTFMQKLYGNSGYGNPVIGNKKSISMLTAQNLADFYHRLYVKQNAIVVIVGNITLDQAKEIATKLTQNLPQGQIAPKIGESVLPKAESVNLDFPSTQTYIRLGTLGIARSDSKYFPLVVGNYILGGGMTSRLYNIVREQNGLSYGVGSNFVPLANRGPFIINLQTRTEMTQKAVEITKQVLQNYYTSGPTEPEIIAAKRFLTGNFPLRFDNNSDIVVALILLGFYHLPLNYYDTYVANIEKTQLAEVQKAMHLYTDPNKMIAVMVGKTK